MKKYNSVQELFLDLPQTVLLVGNGKSNNMGKIIDSYEFVIRFNDFKIEGYESDVGTKVDGISFHSGNLTMNHTKYMLPTFKKYVNKSYIFTTSEFSTKSKKEILHKEPKTNLFAVNYRYMSPEYNYGRLSSGGSLALNLSIYFQKNVHMVGFDGYKTGHYYDDNFNVKSAHNHEVEFQILNNIKNVSFLDR